MGPTLADTPVAGGRTRGPRPSSRSSAEATPRSSSPIPAGRAGEAAQRTSRTRPARCSAGDAFGLQASSGGFENQDRRRHGAAGIMMAMSSLAFDTHAAVKRLQGAGADERLAEAFVSTFGSMLTDNVATKSDIADLRATTKSDIAELRADLKTEIANLRTRSLWKFSVYMGLLAGVPSAAVLVKLLDSICSTSPTGPSSRPSRTPPGPRRRSCARSLHRLRRIGGCRTSQRRNRPLRPTGSLHAGGAHAHEAGPESGRARSFERDGELHCRRGCRSARIRTWPEVSHLGTAAGSVQTGRQGTLPAITAL